MDSDSHIALPLVNPDAMTERINITYEYKRKKKLKTCLGLYYVQHTPKAQNLSFLYQQSRFAISLSMRCPLVYRSMTVIWLLIGTQLVFRLNINNKFEDFFPAISYSFSNHDRCSRRNNMYNILCSVCLYYIICITHNIIL